MSVHYNKKIHSSLNGKTPENRYFEESMLIRRLDDSTIEASFLLEYERKVSADNVITTNDVEYEVPYIYAKQKITLRYSVDLKQVYVKEESVTYIKSKLAGAKASMEIFNPNAYEAIANAANGIPRIIN